MALLCRDATLQFGPCFLLHRMSACLNHTVPVVELFEPSIEDFNILFKYGMLRKLLFYVVENQLSIIFFLKRKASFAIEINLFICPVRQVIKR